MPLAKERLSTMEERTLASYRFRQAGRTPSLPKLAPLVFSARQLRQDPSVTRGWLKQEQPDVVLAAAYLVYAHLCNGGYRIPEDLRLINLRQKREDSKVAGCVLDRLEIIRSAILQLHARVQYGKELDMQDRTTIVLSPVWKDGESFPPTGACDARGA
jgi:hypothetical protein